MWLPLQYIGLHSLFLLLFYIRRVAYYNIELLVGGAVCENIPLIEYYSCIVDAAVLLRYGECLGRYVPRFYGAVWQSACKAYGYASAACANVEDSLFTVCLALYPRDKLLCLGAGD